MIAPRDRECARCGTRFAKPSRYCDVCRPIVIGEWRRYAAITRAARLRRAEQQQSGEPFVVWPYERNKNP